MAGGQRVAIDWRLPTFAATAIFVKFAGPIMGIMASKVAMYSERPRRSQWAGEPDAFCSCVYVD